MKPLLVLRPEPGNRATMARAHALGLAARSCPLFTVAPVAWAPPDGSPDFVLFTSANAVRHGGPQLAGLARTPALAVGAATAEAARAAGFDVAMTGVGGVEELLDSLPGRRRLLHLAGADHHVARTRHAVETVIVYRATARSGVVVPAGPSVALVHSARAGSRLAALAPVRSDMAVAAISSAAATACGDGWAEMAVAEAPGDAALLALAARLCQD